MMFARRVLKVIVSLAAKMIAPVQKMFAPGAQKMFARKVQIARRMFVEKR